ncbi:MAG: glucuronosyltransferase [Nitrospirota bacterium]
MTKVTLVTGHYWGSKRRAGFHHLAHAYHKLGYEVLFFTAPVSYLLKLKGDYRFEYNLQQEAGRIIEKEKGLYSYVHFTPWHVANLRLNVLNKLSQPFLPLYSKYSFSKAEEFISASDFIIFESSPGLYLFERFKQLNKKARFAYRVSDDLRLLNVHPSLIKLEERILPEFDLVSVPSSYIFNTLEAHTKKLQLNHHGINKRVYDEAHPNPYRNDKVNLVFIGNDYFDLPFLEIASEVYKDYLFHIIGPIADLPKKENVKIYGEMPFLDTVPYVQYADAGLHTLSYKPGSESFTDSLKVLQYSYCKLPIVAPDFLRTARKNTFCYTPGNKASIKNAIAQAINSNKESYDNIEVKSWEEVAVNLWESARS